MMTIEKLENENGVTLALEGWLDTLSAAELGNALDTIEEAGSITLDFDRVEYIASAGLRQIVAGSKKAKGMNADFSVINVSKEVMNIVRLTGLEKKINIVGK